jgi:hypothetical protein
MKGENGGAEALWGPDKYLDFPLLFRGVTQTLISFRRYDAQLRA